MGNDLSSSITQTPEQVNQQTCESDQDCACYAYFYNPNTYSYERKACDSSTEQQGPQQDATTQGFRKNIPGHNVFMAAANQDNQASRRVYVPVENGKPTLVYQPTGTLPPPESIPLDTVKSVLQALGLALCPICQQQVADCEFPDCKHRACAHCLRRLTNHGACMSCQVQVQPWPITDANMLVTHFKAPGPSVSPPTTLAGLKDRVYDNLQTKNPTHPQLRTAITFGTYGDVERRVVERELRAFRCDRATQHHTQVEERVDHKDLEADFLQIKDLDLTLETEILTDLAGSWSADFRKMNRALTREKEHPFAGKASNALHSLLSNLLREIKDTKEWQQWSTGATKMGMQPADEQHQKRVDYHMTEAIAEVIMWYVRRSVRRDPAETYVNCLEPLKKPEEGTNHWREFVKKEALKTFGHRIQPWLDSDELRAYLENTDIRQRMDTGHAMTNQASGNQESPPDPETVSNLPVPPVDVNLPLYSEAEYQEYLYAEGEKACRKLWTVDVHKINVDVYEERQAHANAKDPQGIEREWLVFRRKIEFDAVIPVLRRLCHWEVTLAKHDQSYKVLKDPASFLQQEVMHVLTGRALCLVHAQDPKERMHVKIQLVRLISRALIQAHDVITHSNPGAVANAVVCWALRRTGAQTVDEMLTSFCSGPCDKQADLEEYLTQRGLMAVMHTALVPEPDADLKRPRSGEDEDVGPLPQRSRVE